MSCFRFAAALYGGIAFTLLYFWRRSLAANMIAHTIVDALPIMVFTIMRLWL